MSKIMPSSAALAAAMPQVVRRQASGTGHHPGLWVTRLMRISALIAERAIKPFVIGRNYVVDKAMCWEA